MGRIQPIWSWGARLPTKYQSLQVALNKPFTKGFMFKGAYTLSKAMNYGTDDGRPRHADVEHAERAVAQLVAGGLRPAAQLPAGLRLGAAGAER